MKTTVRKFFADKNGRLVLIEWPNAPLVGWALLLVIAKFLPVGDWRSMFAALSFAALVFWAVLEILLGTSPFRRVLGLVVLVFSLWNRIL